MGLQRAVAELGTTERLSTPLGLYFQLETVPSALPSHTTSPPVPRGSCKLPDPPSCSSPRGHGKGHHSRERPIQHSKDGSQGPVPGASERHPLALWTVPPRHDPVVALDLHVSARQLEAAWRLHSAVRKRVAFLFLPQPHGTPMGPPSLQTRALGGPRLEARTGPPQTKGPQGRGQRDSASPGPPHPTQFWRALAEQRHRPHWPGSGVAAQLPPRGCPGLQPGLPRLSPLAGRNRFSPAPQALQDADKSSIHHPPCQPISLLRPI